jgi:hypothetical protein
MAALDFPNSPTLNQVFSYWMWDGVKWPTAPAGTGPNTVPICFPWSGKPAAASQVNSPMAVPMAIAPGLAGTTVFANSLAGAGAIFTVNKISGGTVTQLGTVTITPVSHTSCTLAGSGGTLAAGDDLQVIAPALQDANLADVGVTILMTRA